MRRGSRDVFLRFCICAFVASDDKANEKSTQNPSTIDPKIHRKSTSDRRKIDEKSLWGPWGAIRGDWGRSRDAPGTLQERSRTLSGRPGAPPRPLPGRSEGLLARLGSLPGRPGVPPWRVRMGLSRSLGADAISRRFLFDFLMKIRLFISNDF